MTSNIITSKFESSIADAPINYKSQVISMVWSISKSILPRDAKLILLRYLDAGPLEHGKLKDAYVSNLRTANETGIGLSTVERVRKKLRKLGVIREVESHERNSSLTKRRSQIEIVISKLRVLALFSVTPQSEGCHPHVTPQSEGQNNKTLLNNKNVGVSASQEEKKEEKKDEKVISQRSKIREKIERAKKRGEIHQRYKDLEELEREVNAHVNENKSKGFTEAQSIKGAITMIRDGAFNTPTGYRKERERENSQLESQSNRKTGTWIDAGMSVQPETQEENERKYQEQLRRFKK